MPEIRLTKRAVDAIPLEAKGQTLYRDTLVRGLGLRVGSRTKSYFVEAQVRRRTVRTTIGRADVMPPEQARKRALAVLAEMYDGQNPNADRQVEELAQATVAEAFERFFEARTELAPSSVEGYSRSLRLYLADWHKRRISEISRRQVLEKHRALTETRGKSTANTVMRHFRSVYNFIAATQDDFPENPVAILTQARAWHRERRRQSVVSMHELPRWWQAVMAEAPHARDFLLIGLFTGMRRNEIAQLKWENVDLVGRALHIPHTKNGDPLDLPLSDFLVDLLSDRRELVGQSEWVFPGKGRTRHIVEVKSFVARVRQASGVEFSMHDLRRTFITIAESLDTPHYALKRLLNHRTDNDVTGGYIVMNAERLREPVERIAEKIIFLTSSEKGSRRNA